MENNSVKPRFEFRTFGSGFVEIKDAMEEKTIPIPSDVQEGMFEEVYLISETSDNVNIKVTGSQVDIKKFVQLKDKLEEWETISKTSFPVTKQFLVEELFPALEVDIPIIPEGDYDFNQIIKLTRKHKDLHPVRVQKRRQAYIVNLAICEFAEVLIENSYINTVSVKAAEADEVLQTMKDIGLDDFKGTNYIKTIKRIMGI